MYAEFYFRGLIAVSHGVWAQPFCHHLLFCKRTQAAIFE